ncbi:MAG: ABC transporter permease [Chitinivibrionales bacterium]|nr:ABC transporter permease [Chitinivibrionales bacterium]
MPPMQSSTAFRGVGVRLDERARNAFGAVQGYYVLSVRAVSRIVRPPIYARDMLAQMESIGADSFPIVAILSVFVGMALSLQIVAEFVRLGLQMYAGTVIGISIISEIGPVLSAVVFAGRNGSGIASELGSMVLRNQVDTLRVFGIDPIRKLITPRIVAAVLMLPCLTVLGDLIALAGGAYIAVILENRSLTIYTHAVRATLRPRYVIPGLTKPLVFGFIVASVACYLGFTTRGGAQGLKSSTTKAFVVSTTLIIVADFIVTKVVLLLIR